MPQTACEWCTGPLRPGQKTCSSRCRGRRHRWLNNIKRAGGADPEAPPPGSPLHGRMGEAARSNTPEPAAVQTAPPAASVAELRRAQRERNAATARAERLLARATEAEAARLSNGPRAGGNARSGVTLSFHKAVAVAQDALSGYVMESGCSERAACAEIEAVLLSALTPTQRQKLEARDATS